MRYTRPVLFLVGMLCLFACRTDSDPFEPYPNNSPSRVRFTAAGPYLYTLTGDSLKIFDTSTPGRFRLTNTFKLEQSIETMSVQGQYLYMRDEYYQYTYNITAPEEPYEISSKIDIASCNAISMRPDRSYVTTRAEGSCFESENLLEIFDTQDETNAVLIKSYPLQSPYALAIDGDYLFVAEGEAGLAVYDIADETDVKLLAAVADIGAYDVTVQEGIAIVTSPTGIYQYQYEPATESLRQLSFIPLKYL